MRGFILIFLALVGTYFYFSIKLIKQSELELIVKQTAAKAQRDFDRHSDDILSDLQKCYKFVLSIIAATTLVCFIWILLLKYNAKIIVWLSIFSLPILTSGALYYSISRYIKLTNAPNEDDQEEYEHFSLHTTTSSPADANNNNGSQNNHSHSQDLGFETALQNILTAEFLSYLRNETLWLVVSISLTVLLLMLVVMLHFLRKRVSLSIALIGQASKAINGVKSSLFFPLLPRTVGLAVFLYGLVVALLIISGGHPTYRIAGPGPLPEGSRCIPHNKTLVAVPVKPAPPPPPPPPPIDPTFQEPRTPSITSMSPPISGDAGFDVNDRLLRFRDLPPQRCVKFYLIPRKDIWKWHAFNLFAVLWMLNFISAIAQTTLAGAFSAYYWTLNKPHDVPFFAITQSFGRVVRYHLSDIAFGSFLMATIKYLRVVIEFVSHRFRKNSPSHQQSALGIASSATNAAQVVQSANCFLRAFFWFLDRFLKYIDRNAYIMMSMYHTGYFESAKSAVKLLYKNSVRALVLDYVTSFVLLISRCLITGFAGYLCYYQTTSFDLRYQYLPMMLVLIGTYFISKGLFSVYSMAVDTLFVCFLIESNYSDGSAERPFYMSKELRKIMKRNMIKS